MTTTTIERVADALTPEWFAARSTGIGSSESAAAAGLCAYRTPLDLFHLKRGTLAPEDENDAMRLGKLLEPIVVSEFSRRSGERVAEYPLPMARHPQFHFMLSTPDAGIQGSALLEAKTSTWRTKLGEEGTDDIPTGWLCQSQQHCAVWNVAVCFVAVLIDGRTLRQFKVERNDTFIDGLVEAERELWERIVSGDAPEPNWRHARTPQLIRELFRSVDEGKVIDLSPDACAAWEARQRCKAEAKRLEAEAESFKSLVLYELGDSAAGILECGTRAVRRKRIERSGYEVKPSNYIDVREAKAPNSATVRQQTIKGDTLLRLELMASELLSLGAKCCGVSETTISRYFVFANGQRLRLSDHEPNKKTRGWMEEANVISVRVDGNDFNAQRMAADLQEQLKGMK